MKTTSNHINVESLWIGDILRIISSGKVGRYEGVGKNGKLRIRRGTKVFLVDTNRLELVSDEEIEKNFEKYIEKNSDPIIPNRPKPKSSNSFTNTIDLHIAKLNPDLENAHPQIILDHQLVMCRTFINDAIERKKNVVTIIHGKGTGVLKEEVIHLLKEFKNVRFAISVNGDGAQEVWLKY